MHKIDKVISDYTSVEIHFNDDVVMRINTNFGNHVYVSFSGCDIPIKAGHHPLAGNPFELGNCFYLMYEHYKGV